MKLCEYVFKEGMYHTGCGSKLIFRPVVKCDKCGRKTREKTNDTSIDRTSNRTA